MNWEERAQLAQSYRRIALGHAARILGYGHPEIEDAVQEATISFLTAANLKTEEDGGRPALYFTRSVRNRANDIQRKQRKGCVSIQGLTDEEFEQLVAVRTTPTLREVYEGSATTDPELDERLIWLDNALTTLGETYPQFERVARLVADGYKQKEISEMDGTPIGTVSSRCVHATSRLSALAPTGI